MSIQYSRQLNRPVRFFGFFTIGELFIVVLSVIIIPQIFGFLTWMEFFAVMFTFLLTMRIGKPEGHVWHFLGYHLRARQYVAGRAPIRRMVIRSQAPEVEQTLKSKRHDHKN